MHSVFLQGNEHFRNNGIRRYARKGKPSPLCRGKAAGWDCCSPRDFGAIGLTTKSDHVDTKALSERLLENAHAAVIEEDLTSLIHCAFFPPFK